MTSDLNREGGTPQKVIAYVLGNYPGKIETFVFNEMRELSRAGWDIYVCPIHHVRDDAQKREAWKPAGVIYAEPYNFFGIVLSHLRFLFSSPLLYLKCVTKYRSYGGKRVIWKSVYFAWVVRKLGIRHVHAHFAWTATDAARVMNKLTGIPFSFTAHAADIYYVPDNLAAKLEDAEFVLTCVENNKTYLIAEHGEQVGGKIHVIYHGVNVDLFKPSEVSAKSVDVLCIANLVEKKGHRYLLEACGLLGKRGVQLKCLIIGDGPQKEMLLQIIRTLGLGESVKIDGRRPQPNLPSVYASSRIFVLPSFVTDSGDRDGIPNVLVEAMAMGLPVISTDIPNLSELIENGVDGILVSEKDPEALADAIEELLEDSDRCSFLGTMARAKIEREFNIRHHILKITHMYSDRLEERI